MKRRLRGFAVRLALAAPLAIGFTALLFSHPLGWGGTAFQAIADVVFRCRGLLFGYACDGQLPAPRSAEIALVVEVAIAATVVLTAIAYIPAIARAAYRIAASATRHAFEDRPRFFLYLTGGAVFGGVVGVFVWAFSTKGLGLVTIVAVFALAGGWTLAVARWLVPALVRRMRR